MPGGADRRYRSRRRFPQILGTKAALAPKDAATIVGFIVNKFRGDADLFADGMAMIAATGWPAFGLAPFFPAGPGLPAEDAFGLGDRKARGDGAVTIAVPMLARIANFDDFDPLRQEANVRLVFVAPASPCRGDLVILPGSKATIADLGFFREQGWDIDLLAHVRRGGRVLGVCGGYQMLGRRVADPYGVEGPPGAVEGLGLLDVETVLTGEKTLREVEGTSPGNGAPFHGYEMHVGQTRSRLRPAAAQLRRRAPRRRDLRERARRGRLCAWAVRRRPPARGLAR